ncbi:hypothetical protein BDF19DRAFT_465937 [Syncephalis fuscata]|nr:hypothetical protein BDF19DRAFT_465937 [Syncephalis fuscata]
MSGVNVTSAASARSLYRQLLRLAYRWPDDPLRPNANFPVALRQAIRSKFEEQATGEKATWRRRELNEHIRALEQLLNNQYKQENPLSERMLSPAGNPNYYTKLMRELERVQKNPNVRPSLWSRLFSG